MMGTVDFGGQLKRVLYDESISPEAIDCNDGFDVEELNPFKDASSYNYSCPRSKNKSRRAT